MGDCESGPRNAPEWFKKEYCKNCDPKCLAYELENAKDPKTQLTALLLQIRCLAANVLFEIVNLSEGLFSEKWKEEAKQAVEDAEKQAAEKSDRIGNTKFR